MMLDNNSLFTRARQLLTFFILLALSVMLSLVLVSDSISSGASNINVAGSLRMIASKIYINQRDNSTEQLKKEVERFQQRLNMLYSQSQLNSSSDTEFARIFANIHQQWKHIKLAPTSIDARLTFEKELDRLVSYVQSRTEQQVQLLRLIQFIAFFLVVLISSITIFRLQRTFITPFKQLLYVATEAGQGNFKPKADEEAIGELGVLAKGLNDMSHELSLTYQDFEANVAKKTRQLEQSNLSLRVLYRSAHSLSSKSQFNDIIELLPEIESCLGAGHVSITLNEHGGLPTDKFPNKKNKNTVHLHPINKHGHAFGALIWTTPADLTPKRWQKELIGVMTNLMATSIDLEQKRHAASRVGIMEERAVIARELHDSLAQSLSYLKLQISLLNKQLQHGLAAEEINLTINEISNGTNTAYKQLREVLTTFRLKLDHDSIEDSIQQSIDEFAVKCAHPISLQYQLKQKALRPNQEIHLLQIIREALSNIQKHAHATQASIHIIELNGLIELEICDDGRGLPNILSKEGHFGLNIMKERAKSLNADLKLSANEPQGTKIRLTFNAGNKK